VLSEEIGPFRSGIWNALVEFTYRIYLDDLLEGRMIQKLAILAISGAQQRVVINPAFSRLRYEGLATQISIFSIFSMALEHIDNCHRIYTRRIRIIHDVCQNQLYPVGSIPGSLLIQPAIGLYLRRSPPLSQFIPLDSTPNARDRLSNKPPNFATCIRSTEVDARPYLSSPRC
jgi:hypothetical protein